MNVLPPASNETLAACRAAGAVTRRNRAKLLADLKAERITLRKALQAKHEHTISGIKVGRLVKAIPGWGPQRTHELLAELGIYPEKTFRSLGPKQRASLIDALT